MNFDSFEALAEHFSGCERRVGAAIVHELQAIGPSIAAEYKRYFGTYGPGWAVLAESTQKERVRLGYSADDPLFRAGELQSLVAPKVEGESLFVGIDEGVTLQDGADAAMVLAALEGGTEDGRLKPRPIALQVLTQMDRFAAAFTRGVVARVRL